MKRLQAVDLFCGAGGFTAGLMQAARNTGACVDLLAINHWNVAIATHSANHPQVKHLCERVDNVDPRKVVDGKLDLLLASPECTHHSNARGGKPRSDQSRATAWHILRWVEALYPDSILIENVREFRTWGPLGADGKPLVSKKGVLYNQFLRSLRALGYTVEDRILKAADYGDATTRERLFIQAQRGRRRIKWPTPTHLPSDSLVMGTQVWRPAREVIDWTLPSNSIFTRKKPLAPATLRRIEAGLQKFCGIPFLVGAGGPEGAGNPQSVETPIGTILAQNHRALVEPFLVKYYQGSDAVSVDEPLPTITANYEHLALCEPFLTIYHGGKDAHRRIKSVHEPLSTLDTQNRIGLCQPFLLKYHGAETNAHSIEEPLGTITTKDRFGLVTPNMELPTDKDALAYLDINFRMLHPHELAAAMSFPEEYRFCGSRADMVKQIGNAVPVQLAAALCSPLLSAV